MNGNGMNDAGDELIVPFNQQIQIASATTDDLHLPVTGDSLGNDAEVKFTVGPGRHELTITMGASPSIKTRQDFNANVKTANAASGIDVSDASLPTIRNQHGVEARASTPIDVVPGFVDLDQAMEQLYNELYNSSGAGGRGRRR